jgi:outer membrane protein OmpA-like peptidoglycan-associated protein
MKRILPILMCLTFFKALPQDFLGLQTSNYAGVAGVYSNPANIAENRLKVDVVLLGFNFNAANNYVGVKRSSLHGSPTGWFQGGSWDSTRQGSADYWKNNFVFADNGSNKSVYSNTRIMLPSFMICLNRKNSIAFNWSVRNYINVDGIGPDLAKLAFAEFKDKNLWLTNLNNKNFSVDQMAWAEYGFTYGRVLKDDNEHYLKAGITAKLLQGLDAVYMNIKNLDYNFTTSDTLSLFKSDVSYGHSANLDPMIRGFNQGGTSFDKIKQNYKYESYPGFGLDFGLIYEWRPDYQSHKYNMDGDTGLWRKDQNKYKLKAGLAVNDIGGIRFRKGELSNDFNANINLWDLHAFNNVKSVNGYDSLLRNVFGSKPSDNSFKMALPTSINANIDYNIWKPFYINLMANFANLQPNKVTRVHDFTNISLAPRFDHKWFGLTIPVSYNTQYAIYGKPIIMGTMVRLGPLIVGTNDLSGLFVSDLTGASLYFMLKVPIPYNKVKDRDNDHVSDKKDLCKTIPGVWEFKGCPDRDGDHIKDSEDKCPDVPGLKELQGCPDKDGDGITDAEDDCPDVKGIAEFKGCPDRDGDKIMDKEDECPDEPGLKEFMGCPDKDGDGTPDKFDACPDIFGPKEYKGCPDRDGDGVLDKEDACVDVPGPKENKGCPWPDTDKDGILDKDDACPTTPGVAQYKGCPPPPPVKPAEMKIIEKAFSSLEFATAKDIIKPKSYPSLNDLAKLLVNHKGDWKLKLSGHTDNEGNADKNMLLSEKRSKAVKAYLVKKGVPADNIITEWFGQTQPIADNSTPAGRQKNRRVEMKIIFKEQQ